MGDDRHLPDGQVGFAIASPQLILREGKRIIDITLNLINDIAQPEKLKSEYFQVSLSSTEDWIAPEFNPLVVPGSTSIPDLAKGAFGMSFETKAIRVRVVLERDDLPVDSLGEELAAKAGFDTQWPLIKVVINPELEKPCPAAIPCPDEDPENEAIVLTAAEVYEMLRTLVIGEIVVKVDVRGIRENLIIQSDQGVFDGTQKVFPFGPVPAQGNQFYIGSTEVFQKALDTLIVHFKWIDTPLTSFEEHYDAYKNVGLKIPDPAVQIDFIDKAQESVFKKISKSGKLGADKKVKGSVSDVSGNLLNGVLVEALNTTNQISTDADGKFEIVLTDGTNTATQLKLSKGADDFEELVIDVDDFSTIRVVLFPRKIKITGVFNNQVSGRVTDVYGNLLSGVNILGAPTGQQTDSVAIGSGARKDNYVLTGIPNTGTLTFTLPNHETVENVGFANFDIVDVILFPEQKTVLKSTPLPIERIVSGTISGTDGSASVPDATIFAESATALVKTKSRATGSYTIHLPGATNQLNFLTHQNLGSVEENPVSNGIISVELFPHLHLKKQIPFNGNISGRVTNVQGGGIGGALVEVVGDSSKNTNTDNTGKFSITGLTENTDLKISKTDFQTLTFQVGKCSELEIKLYPALNKRALQSGASFSGSLSGKVTGLDGIFELEGVEIKEGGTTKATTTANGNYSITSGLSSSPTLTFNKPGFKTQSVQITNQVVNV
ncbi:MAG: carboxypeptidase-like regulatory domain-containing protein, partial [Thermoanaerobaculia bacterium]|nr:carboxypeptidase-like regulatory domain-containing protein [Thermoanaerobaculia bacterium]